MGIQNIVFGENKFSYEEKKLFGKIKKYEIFYEQLYLVSIETFENSIASLTLFYDDSYEVHFSKEMLENIDDISL